MHYSLPRCYLNGPGECTLENDREYSLFYVRHIVASASSEFEHHPPSLVLDGSDNSEWVSGIITQEDVSLELSVPDEVMVDVRAVRLVASSPYDPPWVVHVGAGPVGAEGSGLDVAAIRPGIADGATLVKKSEGKDCVNVLCGYPGMLLGEIFAGPFDTPSACHCAALCLEQLDEGCMGWKFSAEADTNFDATDLYQKHEESGCFLFKGKVIAKPISGTAPLESGLELHSSYQLVTKDQARDYDFGRAYRYGTMMATARSATLEDGGLRVRGAMLTKEARIKIVARDCGKPPVKEMVGGTCFGGICGPAPAVEGTRGLFFDGVSVMAQSGDRTYRTCLCRSPEVCESKTDGWLQVPGKIFIAGSNVTMTSTPASAGETFSLTLDSTVADPVYAWAAAFVKAPSLCSGSTSDFTVTESESSMKSATFSVSQTYAEPGRWHVCVCLTFVVPNEAGDLPPCEDFTLAGSVDVSPQPDTYALLGAIVASGLDAKVWTVTGGTERTFSVLGAGPDALVAATMEANCANENFLLEWVDGDETFRNSFGNFRNSSFLWNRTSDGHYSNFVPAMDKDFFLCVKDPLHCNATSPSHPAFPLCGKWHVAGRVRVTTRVVTEMTWHVAESEAIEVLGTDLQGSADMFGIFCGSCAEPQAACEAPKLAIETTAHPGFACDVPMIGEPIYGVPLSDCVDQCLRTSGCAGVQVFDGDLALLSSFCALHGPCDDELYPETGSSFYAMPKPTTKLNFYPKEPVPAGEYRACFCDTVRTPACDKGDLLDLGKVVVSALTCGRPVGYRCAAQSAGGYRCS